MKRIIKNELLLQPTTDITMNEELVVVRKEQVSLLFNMLKPDSKVKCPIKDVKYFNDPLKYIWGWKGTGKTTMLKWYEKQIKSIERQTIFINCRFVNNPGRLLDEILKKLQEHNPVYVPKSKYVRQKIAEYVQNIKDKQVYLMLDEIDKPLRNSKSEQKDEFLHFIIRLVSENPSNNFKVILTTNVLNIERMLSDEVTSYLGNNKIIFGVYTVPEIVTILERRAEIALLKNSYDKKDLFSIAQVTYNSFDGDIRTALGMLLRLAKKAEDKIDISLLHKVVEEIQFNILRSELFSLPKGVQVLLHSLVIKVIEEKNGNRGYGKESFSTEEIYNIYSDFCDKEGFSVTKKAMFYRYINTLIDAFILTRHSSGLKLVENPIKLNSCLERVV